MNDRIARLRESLEEPLLVTNPTNVVYLVGFQSSNTVLLVDGERVQLFTDFRYLEAARAVDGVEVVQTKRAILADLAGRLSGAVGVEAATLSYAQVETLRGGGIEVVPRAGLVERLRAVKDASELDAIRRACRITDRVYEKLSDVRFIGRTERDVSWDVTRLFHEEGGEGLAFETIVGSGPTGSRPHARAGDREIGRGELVVIDAGCTVDGYASDYTRTFSTGPVDEDAREAYAVVLAAQETALETIRAGLQAIEVDGAARRVIEESRFAGTFGHGLGHGLGLDVHEDPRMSTETTDVLAAGNVVTVEPGVYVEGRFGVRIEDDVVVTPAGIENLTGFTKDLLDVS
ncbi:MAG TPA: Xaa-Pro peptidase family protein [Gaiellaceae bacterium]|nr:Xaa-Pro peptidase family protein [Gaiellaceae bacterium]